MRVTQHFHRGLPLGTTQQKKRKINSEKHTEIFLEFLVFHEGSKLKKGKQKMRKLFTRESSQQAKEELRTLFGLYF